MRSLGTHERSILFPEGNRGFGFVARGNKLCSRFVFLCCYTLCMGARFLLEQPGGSRAELHPRMQSFFAQQYVYTTSIWGGAYANDPSEATPKRHVLYSNDPALLSRLTTCAGHLTQEQLRALSGEPLVKKQKKADGTRTWQGCKETMGKSQLLGCNRQ